MVVLLKKSKKLKQIRCPSTGGCIDNVVYLHNGILFRNVKEWITDTCYNIDKPQNHYAKSKKAKTKITYCMLLFIKNIQKRQIYEDR